MRGAVSRGHRLGNGIQVRAKVCTHPAKILPRKRLSSNSYCSFAYSALASFRMGMSGSASKNAYKF